MRKLMALGVLVIAVFVFSLPPALAGGRAVALTDSQLAQVYGSSCCDDDTVDMSLISGTVVHQGISISDNALASATALHIVNAVNSPVAIQTNISVGTVNTQLNTIENSLN